MEKPPQDPLDDALNIIKSMMTGCVGGGVFGAASGATLAAIRGDRIGFYAASMGANFALTTASYVTFHELLVQKRGKRDLVSYVIPGTITGGGLLALVSTPIRAAQGAAAGTALGAGVFFASRYFEQWRHANAVERYIAKYGEDPLPDELKHKPEPLSDIDFPSIVPSFVHIKEDEIEQRIQARVRELQQADSNSSDFAR
ncbi:hypothetical protein LEN26_010186 [Aphanomyces euteiches]|nr:hypothetical protein AeMF1_017599 [Aphanomyces euteiches]KAH9122530.1 hypothetical protein LEN26_010186 [Aphanomyces euteiches]KAH9196487.1 hypothetical protein AeNC1_001511 [Aphanomyces euteiches]